MDAESGETLASLVSVLHSDHDILDRSPGRAVAEQSAWLATGCILAMFDISKAVDREGAAIEPSGRYTSGLTR